jgi:DNA-directed RNA polymerase subunit RPC12/RpoP
MMKYEAKGKCPNCHKEVLRLWEDPRSRIPAQLTELGRTSDSDVIDCPFCNSKMTLIISEISDLPRHNLRSTWSRQ